jgi:hypothetical protein
MYYVRSLAIVRVTTRVSRETDSELSARAGRS